MSKRYFGTDGIRGKMGTPPITPDFILKLGWAVGKVLCEQKRGKALIGKDTRISGYMFESALEAGLVAAGVDVLQLGPMPTPAIAYLTRTLRADLGIVISASHNPYDDNGIKFFTSSGRKLSDSIERHIEEVIEAPLVTVNSSDLGKAQRVVDAPGRYIEFCKSVFPNFYSLKDFKLVIDCAHGATYHIAPNVFRELGAEVVTLGDKPDGFNINRGCGSTHIDDVVAKVVEVQADVGIAFDGDGDRVILVDHKGEVVNGDGIVYLLAKDYQERGLIAGGVVGTVMSNLGLELALKEAGIPFYRAAVGDRYVLEEMAKQNCHLGGESSGHIICLDKTTTGDGIIAALQVLQRLITKQKSLHELKQGWAPAHQVLKNVPLKGKSELMNHPLILAKIKESEAVLSQRGRVLLRPSGTEPVIRVMVEGEQLQLIEIIATEIADTLGKVT